MSKYKNYQEDQNIQKHRWLILTAVGLFTFMSTLDGSIVNIALPTISKDVRVPMNQAEWIVSIYLMIVCSCLLLFGKLGDSFGKVRIFKLGTFIFVFGSFLCGIPHSLGFLLFARLVQAVGASMTMATNSGIITEIFPLQERGRALGMIGSFVSLGSIAGPGIGGLLLAKFSWSYIFWINVPIGLFTILLGAVFLPKDLLASKKTIDYVGFLIFSGFILGLFGGIFLGQELGFVNPWVFFLLFVSVVFFVIFYFVEKNKENPLVSFSLFHNKMFTVSLFTATLIFTSNFFINVILPFFLQNVQGYSASFAGMLMMVFPLVMVVGAPISGWLTDRVGPEILTIFGLLFLTITQLLYVFLGTSTPLILFVMMTALMGLGNALFQSPNNTIVMSSVEKKDLGIAGSLNSLARNFGMVVGISSATTILYRAMSSKVGYHITSYIDDRPDVFIYGMHITFIGSFIICLLATGITAYRFWRKKRTIV